MLLIEVNNDIGNKNDYCFWFDNEASPFSADQLKAILEENPDEKEIKLNINCNGGSTREGFIIYDILRMSGKTIYTNIEGGCHSMAVVLLLSAPFENRSANPNATALIHDVYSYVGGSTEDIKAVAESMEEERERILNIYEDRTGQNKDELRALMLQEKEHKASDLLNWGFIAKINNYNTNSKKNTMSKEEKGKGLLSGLSNLFGKGKPEIKNYTFTDEDGNTLFETTGETDILEVGLSASPDGTFEHDGLIVTISEGQITAIVEKEEAQAIAEEIANLREEKDALRKENEELQNKLKERRGKESNYRVEERKTTPKNGGNSVDMEVVRKRAGLNKGGKNE